MPRPGGALERKKLPKAPERHPSGLRADWRTYTRELPNGCLEWLGAHSAGGYAESWNGQTNEYVHRLVYMTYVGPIPDGLFIDHLCNNRGCVNPEHLRVCTNAENVGRAREERTHCRRGHLLEGENVRMEPRSGGLYRRCLPCRTEEKRLRDERREAVSA